MRSSEDQVLWTSYSAFSATNGVLLVALFQMGKLPGKSIGDTVSVFGILIATIWLLITLRALGHVDRHELLIKRLDGELTRANPSHSLNYKGDYVAKAVHPRFPKAKNVMVLGVLLLLIAWVSIFLYFFLS